MVLDAIALTIGSARCGAGEGGSDRGAGREAALVVALTVDSGPVDAGCDCPGV